MNALPQIPLEGVIETPFLAQKAGAIRALAKNVARDIAEIGRHLTEITKAEKQSSADVKKMRKELDEAGAVTGFIHDTYGNLASLPEPKIAVARAAKRLPHAVHPEKARMVAQWLTAFADEWEKRK